MTKRNTDKKHDYNTDNKKKRIRIKSLQQLIQGEKSSFALHIYMYKIRK